MSAPVFPQETQQLDRAGARTGRARVLLARGALAGFGAVRNCGACLGLRGSVARRAGEAA